MQYLYKRRAITGTVATRFGRKTKYGKWCTLKRFPTLAEAQAWQLRDVVGLYDRAVFYAGKRVTDSVGRIR